MIDPRALIDVELLLMAQQAEHARAADAHEQQWRNFLSVAPTPVVDYVWDIDDEVFADRATFAAKPKAWMQANHPLFDDVMEGLDRAVYEDKDRLEFTLGWMLKHSWQELEYSYARDRQPITGGIHMNAIVGAMAAEALLDWSLEEAHHAWMEPELFVQRWRMAATQDPDVLERAGLHAAELALLAA